MLKLLIQASNLQTACSCMIKYKNIPMMFASFPMQMNNNTRAYNTINRFQVMNFSNNQPEINQTKQQPPTINPTPKIPFQNKKLLKASNTSIFKFLLPYYLSPRIAKIFSVSMLFTFISKGLVTLSPFFKKNAINSLLNKGPSSIKLFAMSFLVQILGTIISEIRNLQLNQISAEIGIKFAKEMMSIICHMEYQEFKNNSEMIINSIHKTLVGLDRFNRWVIGNIISNTIEIIMVSLSLSSYLGRKYFFFTFLTYGIYIIVSRKISLYRHLLFRERKYAELAAENKLIDIVNNIQDVKYFSGENMESESYSQLISVIKEKDAKIFNSLAVLNSLQSLIMNSGIMLNMTSCVRDCLKGQMTPGDLFLLQGVFTQLMIPLNIIGVLMRELEESKINLNYGIKLKNTQQSHLENSSNMKKFQYQKGLIEIKNLSFDYAKKTPVLNKVSALFEPGKINCIIGESGQGKSTLFDLIYKLFTPKEGQIFIDGQDISLCDVESVRKHLTICPQNGFLFNESIQHNILYANPSMSNNDMVSMLKKVNLLGKISKLKDKWLTNVGTLGGKLSGGEKQRLVFARSLIKNGDIILLDEPTSNLDSENENSILDLIRKEASNNKTVIISAHKLSTIAKCDKIFMINQGTIKESGTHEELMSLKGYYYNIVEKQTALNPLKLL